MAEGCYKSTSLVLGSGIEGLMRAEIREHSGAVLHGKDDAEPVRAMRHLITHGELLGRTPRRREIERTAGQAAPGCGAMASLPAIIRLPARRARTVGAQRPDEIMRQFPPTPVRADGSGVEYPSPEGVCRPAAKRVGHLLGNWHRPASCLPAGRGCRRREQARSRKPAAIPPAGPG